MIRLELDGFAERQRSATDEWQVHIVLTEHGRALQKKTKCLAKTFGCRSGMKAGELMALNARVGRLRDAPQESAARAGLCVEIGWRRRLEFQEASHAPF